MNSQSRMLLASAISLGLVLAWPSIFGSPAPEQEPAAKSAASAESSKSDGASGAAESGASSAAVANSAATPEGELQKVVLRNDVLKLQLENHPGGVLRGLELTDAQFLQENGSGEDFLHLTKAGSLEFAMVGEGLVAGVPRRFAEVVEKSEKRVVFRRSDSNVEVTETIELQGDYNIRYNVEVTNKGSQDLSYRPSMITRMGIDAEHMDRYAVARGLCSGDEGLEDASYSDVDEEAETFRESFRWFGLDTKYFLQAVASSDHFGSCTIALNEGGDLLVNRGVGQPTDLAAGKSVTHRYGLFVGPKLLESVSSFDLVEGADMEQAIEWGFFGGLSKVLGRGLLFLMRWFYELTGIWGVSIILLTVLVKGATLPLTIKNMSSMRKMQELKPELDEIKKRYADDKLKLNQEMQALFARSGVNPMAGCLPMLVQLPVWFALYSMIGAAVELYHQPFLWLSDLSMADPFYILPVLAGAASWLQMRIQPMAGDPQQAAMMRWLMPGMFLFMTLVLPSGLGVYMVANSTLSLVQSYVQLRPAKKATVRT